MLNSKLILLYLFVYLTKLQTFVFVLNYIYVSTMCIIRIYCVYNYKFTEFVSLNILLYIGLEINITIKSTSSTVHFSECE